MIGRNSSNFPEPSEKRNDPPRENARLSREIAGIRAILQGLFAQEDSVVHGAEDDVGRNAVREPEPNSKWSG
jgi:hypothetical protein